MLPTRVLILLLFLLAFQLQAATDVINEKFIPVSPYTTKQGLASNDIQDVVQDNEGFIWLATSRGLSRFDSSTFTNFIYDKSDPQSLPDNFVENLLIMPDNQLWSSIYEIGISIFDTKNQIATSVKNSNSTLFKLPNKNLLGIAKDKNNNVWLSLYGKGIYKWDLITKQFTKHLDSDDNAWLQSKKTFETFIDSKNRLWVCTIDSLVFRYDIDTGQSKQFNFSIDANNPLSNPIYGFTESKRGEIFAGGYSGVFKYNEKLKTFNEIVSQSSISKYYNGKRTSVRSLLVDSSDNLWIGTTSSLLQYSKGKLYRINIFEDGQVIEKKGWAVHSLLEGKDGNIWVGTEGMGLLKFSADWNRYHVYISDNTEPIDMRRAFLYKDKLWIVHPSSRVDLLSIKNNKLSRVRSFKPQLGENIIRIDTIYQDHDDYFWISTLNGIHKVNTHTGVSLRLKDPKEKKLGNIKHFHKAKNNLFYFDLYSEEIGFFNPKNMQAHLIQNTEENHLKGTLISQISDGSDNNIWLATDYGIETIDLEKHKFGHVFQTSKGENISSFYIDENQKNVWIIKNGGLFNLKWKDNILVKQDNKYINILPKIKFKKIKRFKGKKLIITSDESGLIEIDVDTLDYTIITKENGLPSNTIKEVLFYDGNPVIITESGIAIKNASYQETKSHKPVLIIDKITIGETSISTVDSHKIILNHDYGSLNFDVTLLSYASTSTIEYQYKLNGASNKWINSGTDNKFSFLNLKGGNYSFQIKGRSNYGQWSDVVSFPFKVKPHPWKTLWAYLFYLLLIFLLLFWFMYLYKRKILYEHEITKQQAKKDIANAASKAKSDFLARVSHEVRTPLNGVLGMSELMQSTNLDDEQKIYNETINTSGNHLLDIINDILDLSKIESGKLEMELHEFDLLVLVDEVIGTFASQSRQKNLLFTCLFNHDIIRYRIGDIIRIKQVLFNLLSNAFKFTRKGEIKLTIKNSKVLENSINIVVEDTGIGLNNDTIDDLFKPFIQADSAITRKYGGTGLGLAIVKQLAEKMHGNISAINKTSGGSIFTLEIPLKLNTNKRIKQPNNPTTHSCLFIQQSSLKLSLKEYFKILKIECGTEINRATSCVFIDTFNTLNESQCIQLELAKKFGTQVVFMGFELNNPLYNVNDYNNWHLIAPPITSKKLIKLCETGVEDVDNSIISSPNTAKLVLKILVVEDNVINQQVSIEMLERMGHMVDIVDNAEEALIMLDRNEYNLLMTDYHLPGMDGLHLIKSWSNPQSIPVIIVTADLTDDVIQQCEKLELYNIVAKPFTQQALFSAIEKAL